MDLNFSNMVEQHRKDQILENTQKALDKFLTFTDLQAKESELEEKLAALRVEIDDCLDHITMFSDAGVHDTGVVQKCLTNGNLTMGQIEVPLSAFEEIKNDSQRLLDLITQERFLQIELMETKIRRTELQPVKE